MRASFSRWLIQRRALRVALIAGVLPLGFLGIFSAAIVVLVAVFKGWQEALVDCAMALLILAVVTLIAGGGVIEVVMSAALTWLVAIGLGGLTGVYASLSLSIQAAIVIGVLGLMVFSFIVGDAVAFWEEFLTDFAQQMAEFGVQVAQPEMFLQLAPVMSGMVAASVVITSIVALLIGSWWAGSAGGPGFRQMFLQIRLGYVIGGLAAVAGVAALVGLAPLAGNVLLVISVGFVFQGMAVIHWHVVARDGQWTWLIPLYLPLFMGASIAGIALFLLATLGFIDNWYRLRRAGANVV